MLGEPDAMATRDKYHSIYYYVEVGDLCWSHKEPF